KAFLWEAPSGRRLPVFNGWHYMMGNFLGLGDVDAFAGWLPTLQRLLDEVGWVAGSLPIQVTHPFGDNGTAWPRLGDFVREWNQRGQPPYLQMSTYSQAWGDILKSEMDVWRGDWTDYWNFGAGSSARETAM